MKIYTSYFANIKNLPDNIFPVGIARFAPKYVNVVSDTRLAPHSYMLKLEKPIYEKKMSAILNKLDAQKVFDDLQRISKGKDVALLCYEKLQDPNEWCHRTMVAQWLNEKLGIEVVEYGREPEPQINLFDE